MPSDQSTATAALIHEDSLSVAPSCAACRGPTQGSMSGGHYTAYARTARGPPARWHHFSDTHVSEVNEAAVLGSQAFLLFYERVNPETANGHGAADSSEVGTDVDMGEV
eukprot:6202902-Pleurochrysis_carterae.AAC.4